MLKDYNVLVTGGAGFIGSHLVDYLVKKNDVCVVDNLSTGRKEFLNRKADFVKGSILKLDLREVVNGIDIVFHLAANPEVRKLDPENQINQNFLVTYELLESMRKEGLENLVFTSSSTVYGEAETPTNENHPTFPISLYGASKLASEALISSYCHSFGLNAWIYRFANVVGDRLRHGVIYDFINKLREDPEKLEILGNGKQKKSYIHIDDCIQAMIHGLSESKGLDVYNIGSEDQIKVIEIARIVSEEMGLDPSFNYTGGRRGWRGDVPIMLLATEKLRSVGWNPKHNSEGAVRKTVKDLLEEIG